MSVCRSQILMEFLPTVPMQSGVPFLLSSPSQETTAGQDESCCTAPRIAALLTFACFASVSTALARSTAFASAPSCALFSGIFSLHC